MSHYMPWYASKPISGHWGWHWTMNHYNPDKVDADGRRSIASHDYPLIGTYDSSDSDVLECQVLLMKFTGIDGVIIDWYGIEDFYDYATIHRNTVHIINQLQKARLQFAICYEDRTIRKMIQEGHLPEEDAVKHGQEVMRFLQKNWFNSQGYLKVDARPALFVFGPQYFQADQWNQLFSLLPKRPFFYTLNRIQEGAPDGAFGWPPMHGGVTSPSQWHQYLDQLYNSSQDGRAIIGAAFPKFHDIYQDVGLHRSYGFLDDQDGQTFANTLDIGLNSASEIIQLVTWNDYGEGTMIEPTVGMGYRYLEMIQSRSRTALGKSFIYVATDLRLPVALYLLKKKYQDNPLVIKDLDKASGLLFSGNLSLARHLLKLYR